MEAAGYPCSQPHRLAHLERIARRRFDAIPVERNSFRLLQYLLSEGRLELSIPIRNKNLRNLRAFPSTLRDRNLDLMGNPRNLSQSAKDHPQVGCASLLVRCGHRPDIQEALDRA